MARDQKISDAVATLRDVAERIRRFEEEARESLFVRDDIETYRLKLQEKTMLLMELSDVAAPYSDGLPGDFREELESELNSLETRAARAWELASVFYMSALLYPEDYKEGEKNDLENFIERLCIKYLP